MVGGVAVVRIQAKRGKSGEFTEKSCKVMAKLRKITHMMRRSCYTFAAIRYGVSINWRGDPPRGSLRPARSSSVARLGRRDILICSIVIIDKEQIMKALDDATMNVRAVGIGMTLAALVIPPAGLQREDTIETSGWRPVQAAPDWGAWAIFS